ncbi:hypothetical protein ADUPG1_006948 [Aduncisulcus paluster]|uniref:HECT-type E3 ubiquitin transferase n=1 Tax=Aduncisulcus paluster TaxID=2918883 RepID=A0ABQ5KLU0_9EUKA|nr:hypothetical protein ADUPG1_006948 [Aduncisulcus paluster]
MKPNDCDNEYCCSSPSFKFRGFTMTALATKAMLLFRDHGESRLCSKRSPTVFRYCDSCAKLFTRILTVIASKDDDELIKGTLESQGSAVSFTEEILARATSIKGAISVDLLKKAIPRHFSSFQGICAFFTAHSSDDLESFKLANAFFSLINSDELAGNGLVELLYESIKKALTQAICGYKEISPSLLNAAVFLLANSSHHDLEYIESVLLPICDLEYKLKETREFNFIYKIWVDLLGRLTPTPEQTTNIHQLTQKTVIQSLVYMCQQYMTIKLMQLDGDGLMSTISENPIHSLPFLHICSHLKYIRNIVATELQDKTTEQIIDDSIFYNDYLNSAVIQQRVMTMTGDRIIEIPFILQQDLEQKDPRLRRSGRSVKEGGFRFTEFPFLIHVKHKRRILRHEAARRQEMESQQPFPLSLFDLSMHSQLVLNIYRQRLLQSAVSELERHLRAYWREQRSESSSSSSRRRHPHNPFLAQLKVKFAEEEGVDEGGVAKEFFQLICQKMFYPDFGMFVRDPDSGLFWFNKRVLDSSELDRRCNNFELVGVLVGLALFNGIVLDVAFPDALWKKLKGENVTLKDLIQLNPSVGASLQSLLDYEEDDIEDVFCLDFTRTHRFLGETFVDELVKDGRKIMVKQDNKLDYVAKYVQYELNSSVEKQFESFKRGFNVVLGSIESLEIFSAIELKSAACGIIDLNFDDLQASCRYDGGYHSKHRCIKMFWKVLKRFDNEQKQNFLTFATGTNRVPIGGLKELKFVIVRGGGSQQMLPSAHTCFNALILPEYDNETILRAKLLKAIENNIGFGLM